MVNGCATFVSLGRHMGVGGVPHTIRTNQMTQRGASPRAAAAAFGLGQHHLRRLIREGLVTPRAIGRRSIVIFSELEEVLRAMPRTKSSKRDDTVAHA
jgi:hypothetical protein